MKNCAFGAGGGLYIQKMFQTIEPDTIFTPIPSNVSNEPETEIHGQQLRDRQLTTHSGWPANIIL